MVARVQRISEGYAIVLTQDALEELNLAEGSAVEIRAVDAADSGAQPKIIYLTMDEGLSLFQETEPEHRRTYEQLAK
jgi:antitoxin component of MazEF toxin-antitoxin module